jgi:integrase
VTERLLTARELADHLGLSAATILDRFESASARVRGRDGTDRGEPHIERVYSQGVLKDCRKSSRQRRRVPLRQRVITALKAQPPRLDTPILFPAARGGYIDGERFRHRQWAPALRAAGIEHRRVLDTRHTFASWSIAGGVQLFHLSRIMGTSVAQIDQAYGHLLPDSEEYLRGLLDDYDATREGEVRSSH